eukprot:3272099-Amphidinium_carterae.2
MINSEATFKARLSALGLKGHEAAFRALGITTVGTLAASSSYVPGASADDAALIASVENKVRKLPHAERSVRIGAFKQKYIGLLWTEQVEPAYAIIDRFHTMREEGQLNYIAPEDVPTRDQEVDHVKNDLWPDSMGLVRQYQETSLPQAQ